MSDSTTRTHYYHADANAIGGKIERPFEQIVPVQAPLSLSAVGGYATSRTKDFHFAEILSAQHVSSQVAGSFNPQNGSWTTLASASVEGLNVLNVVTADRVVAQISTEHPRDSYTPKVSFVGTQFVNLRVNGQIVEPILDLGFCDQGDPTQYPQLPCIENPDFLKRVDSQQRNMRSGDKLLSGGDQQWLDRRYPASQGAHESSQKRGVAVCSLVQGLDGDYEGTRFGHILSVPEFGKIFLGELLVDRNSFHLIMIRLELGCPVQGTTTFSGVRTNGSSYP